LPEPAVAYYNSYYGMAIRTVRLDEEAEGALAEIREATGLPISEALKRGLSSLRDQVRRGVDRRPFDVYKQLDLGPGGYAVARSSDAKRAVRDVVRKKHRR
jgi:hypothetical protein